MEEKNFNIHQLYMMLNIIDDFFGNRIDFSTLVSKLEDLFFTLESINEEWSRLFLANWGNLEEIYADMLYEEEDEITSKNNKLIVSSVINLKKIINDLLMSYVKAPDFSISKSAEIVDKEWLFCPDCLDGWRSVSLDIMVICPKCHNIFHNPRILHKPQSSP